MRLRGCVAALVLLVSLAGPSPGQVVAPYLTEVTVAGQLPVVSPDAMMAVDVEGRVHILDPGPGFWTIHRIRPDGSIDLDHASGTGNAGQIASSLPDGRVYMVRAPGAAGPGTSDVLRIETAGGTAAVGTAGVEAFGFTFDQAGNAYLGGVAGGLYRWDDPSSGAVTLLSNAVAGARLLGLGLSQVLMWSGSVVWRWNPSLGNGSTLWFAPNGPPAHFSGHGLARNPFNHFTVGAVFAHREGAPQAPLHRIEGNYRNIVGTQETEVFWTAVTGISQPPPPYLGQLAAGWHRDLYWIDGAVPYQPARLVRLVEEPAAGETGSLVVTAAPGQLGFAVWGPPDAPLLLGVMTDPLPASALPLIVPVGGVLDLDVFHPAYVPVADGCGAFGPPQPSAVLDAAGEWEVTLAYPPLPAAFPFVAQHVALTPRSPNGLFQIGVPVPFTVF